MTPHPIAGCTIGVDLGGTKTQVARADAEGRIVARLRRPTLLDLADGLADLEDAIRTIADGQTIAGIGVAIGGPIEYGTGIVSPLHQPQWRSINLGALLERWTSAPWRIEVDTNAGALAEWYRGGHGRSRILCVTVSTGVGGGFVADGEIFRGSGGVHPEFGHQTVPGGEGVSCPCGSSGCLESLICGPALKRRYGCEPAELDDAAWAETGRLLGRGLRNAAILLAPEIIVLGGGVVTGAGERLLGPARAELSAGLRLVPVPIVTISPLGYDSTLHGALVLAALVAGRDPASWQTNG